MLILTVTLQMFLAHLLSSQNSSPGCLIQSSQSFFLAALRANLTFVCNTCAVHAHLATRFRHHVQFLKTLSLENPQIVRRLSEAGSWAETSQGKGLRTILI
ncbi:uncharacterized protein BKA55DRAFT_583199 [Fusarium redolens]|uniref:Secreted protein n=1 Tax=Fusarium redolens TaxID=48865 RepID=A0A9P9FZR3_FUSRE|nr:uncharacterized protein BKA55DRAFT_583199 [Fusarium redolens]KAH7201186.1 hypothetical protein DER44DRAFT_783487 [Fusarium oxysporum]KAH7230650.1 hypothetical protein BKA55DRAFT_583199 [Fusarium redolens]